MPDGRILAAVQSTLDVDGKSKNKAQFTRLVSFDPRSGKTAMYGYPIDIDSYKSQRRQDWRCRGVGQPAHPVD